MTTKQAIMKEANADVKAIFSSLWEDDSSRFYDNGYVKFITGEKEKKIRGLVRITGGHVELLVLAAYEPKCGAFSLLLRKLKMKASKVSVWEVWSQHFEEKLLREGFAPCTGIERDGEKVSGFSLTIN